MSVAELQKMIHVWKSRRITDSTVSKLLELYLGLTGYMNSRKVYPQENFYEIRNSLRFATTQAMVEAVKCSQSFPFITDPATGAVKAFWSPLYCKEAPEISPQEPLGLSAQTFAQTFVATDNNDIYNNLSVERTSYRSSSPKDNADIPSEENRSSKENSLTENTHTESAVEFFHRINQNPEQKAQVLVPLIDYFRQQEKTDRPQACRTLVCLVNEQLIPYFDKHPQFPKVNHAGRLVWLAKLLKSAYGCRMLNEAMHSGRVKREQETRENHKKQQDELRNFHPVSPHEWTDRQSGMRFYDDREEGTILIPAEALPRPTLTAQWNVLSKEWSDLAAELPSP